MTRRLALLAVCALVLIGLVPAPASAWPPDVAAAKAYVATRKGDVSFTVIGPKGVAYGWRGERAAHLASVFKVMLLAAYLERPSVRDRDLRDSDRALLGPMIRRSDNLAATRVVDLLGRGPLEQLARYAGMTHFHYVAHPWGASTDTSRDLARFMFNLDRYIPDRHEAYARYLLSHIVASQRWGIAKLRFDGWTLYFKSGWGSGTGFVSNQVAFLEKDGMRVAASVLIMHSPSEAYAEQTLQGVFHRLLQPMPKPSS